ncbi:Calcium-transporting ATPase [Melia azedarach]|uniref:Calcium-transporting ATPase n=1 Tax=Melia azedarach TaxID=155640 RepID=A0ACC1WYV1_MELAZ|nr:Calcium-transporting ATPase [Melia azedarach]
MSSMSSNHDRDIESQHQALLITSNRPRDNWRWIFLIIQACQILRSRADKAKKGSIPSYRVISSEEEANFEITEVEEVLPTSPQLSVDVYCVETNDSNAIDRQRQRENIDRIVKTKDLDSLRSFGGVQGIAEALDTDLVKGIPGDEGDFLSRHTSTTISKAQDPTEGFFRLLLKSCNNSVIFLLFLSAMMSIGFGIKEEGARTGWYEGAIILLAVIILVVVPSIRDFWNGSPKKLLEEQRPSEKKQMNIDVLRGGTWQSTNISNVVIGDIVHLQRGNKVPGDGLFISGDFLKLDDGSTTTNKENPFLYHGAKVVSGCGHMLVTSTGSNTSWNELMSRVTKAPSKTTLPAQLDKVSIYTQVIGLVISVLIPIVVFLHYKLGKQKHENGVSETKGRSIPIKELMDAIKRIVMKPSGQVSFLTTSLTVLVVGMVEGVPFLISLAIFYWNKKALRNKAFAREPMACVSMGSVTTICTDKVGGLKQNQREVGMCWIGEEAITEDSVINDNVLEVFYHGISTDILSQQSSSNSIEDPILSWATMILGMEMEPLKQSCSIVDTEELSSSEGTRVLLRKKKDPESCTCMHWKGPAKRILEMCTLYYDSDGKEKIIDEAKRSAFQQIIDNMHSKDLKTMAFAYKQVDGPTAEDNSLIMIGLLGLKHMCHTQTREAIEACRNAGVNVILVSEDNVSTVIAIGKESGLLCNSSELVLEGEEFRNCPSEEMMKMIDKICGIGNCLPSDKLKLVQCLKQKGQMVAMVGYRTNDTAALKEANVGITMGAWSSESARESSDIIIWDGNFSSLVTILRCGKCTYNNIQKYMQLELTMVIAGLLITTVTTIAFGHTPISAIQWCWANLIVSVPGGLALLTEQPSEKVMGKPPIRQTDSFITKTIWRNIITQALFQAIILVTFQFKSKSILRINDKVIETMVFNSFILCQVFNQFNAREPQMKNIFKGIQRNMFFWVAVSVTLVLQVLFIETAHTLAGDAKLTREQWGICFLIGAQSLAVDLAAKIASSFIVNLVTSGQSSQPGAIGVTNSESASNLELPLNNQGSTAKP